MSLIKGDFTLAGAVGGRTILLRNQGSTVYDITKIRWTFQNGNAVEVSESILAALSTRLVDQVEDAVATDIITSQGVFGIFSAMSDLLTSGATALVGNDEVNYWPPFRVPFAALVANSGHNGTVRLGVEIYFERVEVPAIEKATLVRIVAGGRTRPS